MTTKGCHNAQCYDSTEHRADMHDLKRALRHKGLTLKQRAVYMAYADRGCSHQHPVRDTWQPDRSI
jgi:hypothetical protein